ncbi:YybH family protein [Fulvivirga sedimenti]|uniref:Uncharacterized protein n=1 Tax=Fulvivirga sedimenti TaxID=2879465 RepID=A0A9X1KW70_9BACT|nr:hypothetical protein [Fulvivirga sedimenti]MCA6073669.1 hypothetical protein [Fulvivirga sedimenti]
MNAAARHPHTKLKATCSFVLIFLFLNIFAYAQSQGVHREIAEMNRQMEKLFRNGMMRELAALYLDEGVLLSPGGATITGRAQIDQYWTRIESPVDWKLDVIFVTADEQQIYSHEFWTSLETKPPDWRESVADSLTSDLVFQLGHSTLTTIWEGSERTSEVDFLLVWKKTSAGYRILADSYTF